MIIWATKKVGCLRNSRKYKNIEETQGIPRTYKEMNIVFWITRVMLRNRKNSSCYLQNSLHVFVCPWGSLYFLVFSYILLCFVGIRPFFQSLIWDQRQSNSIGARLKTLDNQWELWKPSACLSFCPPNYCTPMRRLKEDRKKKTK